MMDRKRILVTGGSGFIGTNLVKELERRSHHVIACDLYNTERENYVRCDTGKYRQLEHVFNSHGPFDFIYHLAAESHVDRSIMGDYSFWTSNVIGTRNLLSYCRDFKVEKILNQITDEVFGP